MGPSSGTVSPESLKSLLLSLITTSTPKILRLYPETRFPSLRDRQPQACLNKLPPQAPPALNTGQLEPALERPSSRAAQTQTSQLLRVVPPITWRSGRSKKS